ncbi:MAG: acyl-CoA thioesterase [Planctomycetes bacterium]|nr:acyl-CoA thioesterase [Planctomycetota bacterium]
MFYRFDTDVPLRWVDVDSAGVVNNAVYLSLTEQARFAYFSHLGLLQDHQVPFVLAEATVQWLRPGRLGMAITVAAATTRLGNSSFEMNYEIRNGDEVLCKAKAALVFVDEAMQPRPIPQDFRDTVAQFEELEAS